MSLFCAGLVQSELDKLNGMQENILAKAFKYATAKLGKQAAPVFVGVGWLRTRFVFQEAVVASSDGLLTNVRDVAALIGASSAAQPKPAEPKPTVCIADGLDGVDMVTNLGGEVWCVSRVVLHLRFLLVCVDVQADAGSHGLARRTIQKGAWGFPLR